MVTKKRNHTVKVKSLAKLIAITLYIIMVIIAIIKHGISTNTILELITYGLLGVGIYLFIDNISDDLKEILE